MRNRQAADGYLSQSRQFLSAGDYAGAIGENQKVLSLFPGSPPADEALFNMGLIYVHYGITDKNYVTSLGYFEKLIKEYPESLLAERAKIWVGVLEDIVKLKIAELVNAKEHILSSQKLIEQCDFKESLKEVQSLLDGLVEANEHIIRSQNLMAQGEFKESLKEVQSLLNSKTQYSDKALFHMGLIYAHYNNPEKDYKKSLGYFEKLINEYPQSHLLEQAKTVRGLLNVIEKAGQVDIEIEKKKKELTR